MDTVLLGGISLYHYDPATGTLSTDTELPFVNDVTTYVHRANGSSQEYIMTPQLPARLGAEASFFVNPGVKQASNGVITLNLKRLRQPVVLGMMYGGIYSTAGDTTNPLTQTTSSNLVYQVTLVPSSRGS